MTSARPWISTMPSETDRMVPSFLASEEISRLAILFLMMSLISDGFSCCMPLSSNLVLKSGAQCIGEFCQLSAYRGVDHQITGAYNDTADQGLICLGGKRDLPFELLRQGLGQFLLLLLRQLKGCGDIDLDGTLLVRAELPEQFGNFRQQSETACFSENGEEVADRFGNLGTGKFQDNVCLG